MTRRKQVEVRMPNADGRGGSVLDWSWPPSPGVFKVYDKYADVESNLVYGEGVWKIPVQGKTEHFEFALGAAGLLQQKLVSLTQADSSPSSIYKFTRSLLLNWSTYVQLLEDGPESIEEHWDEQVPDIDTARAAKAVLHLACSASVGPWKEVHRNLIKGLDSRSNAAGLAQRGARQRREKLIDLNRQTQLVKVLDARASEDELEEWEAEGLAALALTFQHGMRPVQLLSLLVEHVNVFKDAAGDWVCIVSFHTAKQQGARTDNGEVLRQVKPEWVKPVIALLEYAKREKRTRLFSRSTGDQLWAKVKRVCADSGFKVDFTAVKLRHTSAQALADAGHSRKSIQWFLAHTRGNSATVYIRASRHQGNLLNAALGASKLYDGLLSLAAGDFITVEDLRCVHEDEQIGAVVGDRLVSGIGRCRTKQKACNYDPVFSCYGCFKYVPALDPTAHMEAIAGMREQVMVFMKRGGQESSPAYLQMMKSLAGAQQALDESTRILREAHG